MENLPNGNILWITGLENYFKRDYENLEILEELRERLILELSTNHRVEQVNGGYIIENSHRNLSRTLLIFDNHNAESLRDMLERNNPDNVVIMQLYKRANAKLLQYIADDFKKLLIKQPLPTIENIPDSDASRERERPNKWYKITKCIFDIILEILPRIIDGTCTLLANRIIG